MNNMIVSVSPHLRDRTTTSTIMRDVIIALIPALVVSVIVFGYRSALIVAVCVATAVLAEWIFEKALKKPNTVGDLSAVVTGILLAYNLPVSIPIWQAMFGSIVAVIVVKQLFGGIGQNFANPAITARIVMFLAFSGTMTAWVYPDGVSTATPLAIMSSGDQTLLPSLKDLFLGNQAGCLGETSTAALLLGGIYLMARRVISWHTPLAFLGTVFLFTLILGQQPVYQMVTGGLMLGAFFMATDYSTTPTTKIGRLIFGLGCGLLTVLIRLYGSYPEGVSFSILLMNIVTPYITSLTRHKAFGGVKV